MRTLMQEPPPVDIEWLAAVATSSDLDRARWELRYLKRALGLLVSQRDALDDRTASSVARALTEAMSADRNVAAPMIRLAERQFNERLSAYRDMMSLRGSSEGVPERLGRTMLLLAGAGRVGAPDAARSAELTERYLLEASERLRDAFGAADLPDGGASRAPNQ
ncbi:MAG: hypothetical protein ACT4P7_14265 [Gemmatimonadaceae bacterium]